MMKKLNDEIKLLIEQRILEAAKNQMTQKLLSIAKNLGSQIIAQNIFHNKLIDVWHLDDEIIYDPTNIQEIDEDEWNTSDLGFHFDGLKCGVNLCITAMIYDNKLNEIKATYNGYITYAEIDGELKSYAPFPAWENAVDMFYEAAVQMEKKKAAKGKAIRQEENRKKMDSFWTKFRRLWGYN